jgi:hypothetical protein
MRSIRYLSVFIVLAVGLIMLDCSKNIAGSEVTNEKCLATIYLPTGKPAKNATVLIVPADYVPVSGTTGLGKSSAMMLSDLRTSTDDQGHFSVNGLADGCYNVMAELDSLVMLHDSIYIATSLLQSTNDTLNLPASLSGIVKIQPNHNVATVIVQALGTNIYANVDSKGQFNLPRLAKGDYQLKFSTSINEYVPKFVSVGILYSRPDTLNDTIALTYTGIPVVTGIKASYDSSKGTVRIQWDTVNYSNLSDFVIYRAPFDTIQSAGTQIGATMNTFLVDSSIRYLDTGAYRFKYRVAILDNSISMGPFYKFADLTLYSPGPLSVQIIQKNDSSTTGSMTLKAQIKSPRGPITNVKWRILAMNNLDSIYTDTLLQKTTYPNATFSVMDSVIVTNPGNYTMYYAILCKATDSWGDTAIDISNITIFPKSNLGGRMEIQLFSLQDSVFVGSSIPLVATITDHSFQITQVQWTLENQDSILKTNKIPGTVFNLSDSLNFSSNTPGLKTIYCFATDSVNSIGSDSLSIWVMPK